MTISRAGFTSTVLLMMTVALLVSTVIGPIASYCIAALLAFIATALTIAGLAHDRR